MSYNDNTNALPGWVQDVRSGQFESAQEKLISAAAQRISEQDAQAEMTRMTEENPYGRYLALNSMDRVRQLHSEGKIRTPAETVAAYRQALDSETQKFRETVRPGYQRDSYNGYIAADAEVHDYISERRAALARTKGLA